MSFGTFVKSINFDDTYELLKSAFFCKKRRRRRRRNGLQEEEEEEEEEEEKVEEKKKKTKTKTKNDLSERVSTSSLTNIDDYVGGGGGGGASASVGILPPVPYINIDMNRGLKGNLWSNFVTKLQQRKVDRANEKKDHVFVVKRRASSSSSSSSFKSWITSRFSWANWGKRGGALLGAPSVVSDKITKNEVVNATSVEEDLNFRTCKVCYEKELEIVFIPCGHMATCLDCGPRLSRCPICREKPGAYVRAYLP